MLCLSARIVGARVRPCGLIICPCSRSRNAWIHRLPVVTSGRRLSKGVLLWSVISAHHALSTFAMVRDGAPPAPAAEGEATTAAARWWDAVNADQLEEAMEIASTIVVPPLCNSFSFDEDEEGNGGGTGVVLLEEGMMTPHPWGGASRAPLLFDSPALYEGSWSDSEIGWSARRLSRLGLPRRFKNSRGR